MLRVVVAVFAKSDTSSCSVAVITPKSVRPPTSVIQQLPPHWAAGSNKHLANPTSKKRQASHARWCVHRDKVGVGGDAVRGLKVWRAKNACVTRMCWWKKTRAAQHCGCTGVLTVMSMRKSRHLPDALFTRRGSAELPYRPPQTRSP